MLNKSLITKLKKDYQSHQDMRHQLIQQSNAALRSSKQAIFSLHRDDLSAAKQLLADVERTFLALQKGLLKKHPQLKQQGAYLAALEEFVEASLLYQVFTAGSIGPIAKVEIGADQYIGGLCDLTGELTRQAVLKATEQDYETVEQYYSLVEETVGALLQFDLVSHLRQKYDDAKRNLKRLEGIRYDISLRQG